MNSIISYKNESEFSNINKHDEKFYSLIILSNNIANEDNQVYNNIDNKEKVTNIFELIISRINIIVKVTNNNLYLYFKDLILRTEVKIMQNYELKALISLYIVLKNKFPQEDVLNFMSNLFSEIYQGYLIISYIIINRIDFKNEYSLESNNNYTNIVNIINSRLLNSINKDNQLSEIKKINEIVFNMLSVFTSQYLNKLNNINISSSLDFNNLNKLYNKNNKLPNINECYKNTEKDDLKLNTPDINTNILHTKKFNTSYYHIKDFKYLHTNLNNFTNYFIIDILSRILNCDITEGFKNHISDLSVKPKDITIVINVDKLLILIVKTCPLKSPSVNYLPSVNNTKNTNFKKTNFSLIKTDNSTNLLLTKNPSKKFTNKAIINTNSSSIKDSEFYILKRPNLENFLKEMSCYFNLALYTNQKEEVIL